MGPAIYKGVTALKEAKTMNALTNHIAKLAAAAVFMGTLAYGQGSVVKVKVPFEFRTATGTLPAGTYTIKADPNQGNSSVTWLRNDATRHTVLAVRSMSEYKLSSAGKPVVIFRCGDDGCALKGIRTFDGTTSYYPSRQSKHDKEIAIATFVVSATKAD